MTNQNCDDSKIPYSYFGSYSAQKNNSLPQTISLPRLTYLRSIFGITGEYCHAFCFDGTDFWIPSQISYKKIKSLQNESAQIHLVNADKYRLPAEICKTQYTYTCLDGSPDMRYSNNPSYVYTYKFLISFAGDDCNHHIYTFALSQHVVNNALEKFNRMLWVKDKVDLESPFESYLNNFKRKEDLQKSKAELDERKMGIEKVVKSFSALPDEIKKNNLKLSTKNEHAISELDSTNKKLKELVTVIEQMNSKMLEITTKLKKTIEMHKSLNIIRSFE